MDLHSDSEVEVEQTASPFRKCGTPGCDLADGHSLRTVTSLCKTEQVTGKRQRRASGSMQEVEGDDGDEEEETKQGPVNLKAEGTPLTAAEARAQAASEGLTLQTSANKAGYLGVTRAIEDRRPGRSSTKWDKQFQAKVRRAGKDVHLGRFATAEEAALVYARANSHATVSQLARARASSTHTVASHQKSTKRAAPPPKPPRTKQARQATATRPSQAVPPPIGIAPAAVPMPAASPAEGLQQNVDRIKAVLQLDPGLPLVEAIKAANELVGIGAAQGATTAPLLSQVDTLLAAIFGV